MGDRYEEISRETRRGYGRESQPDDHPSEAVWRTKGYGAQWRNRVGFPRLTANAAASEAAYLLRKIPLSAFRTDPEVAKLVRAAREAADALNIALSQSNWLLLQTPPKRRKEGA